MARDVFTNNASTTVTSGGTDAPAQGTGQAWTVTSSTSFPAADNTASPATQFYVADPLAPSELILVTHVSGTTWTVTRGADGTTPTTHQANFTVKNVVPSAWFTEVEDRVKARTFDVLEYGATGLGVADETTAFQAAMDAAGAYAVTNGAATLTVPQGRYMLDDLITLKPNVKVYAYGAYIFSGNQDAVMFSLGNLGGGHEGGPTGFEWRGGIIDAKGQDAAADVSYNVFTLFNGRNVVLRDVTIRNVASWHAIDLTAIDGAHIENCRFEGFVDTTTGSTRQYSEAIQIDADNSDFTTTKNVTVRDCYMGPAIDGSLLGSFGALVGSHTDTATFFYTGINVTGNRIVDPITAGIRARSWEDSTITNNIISGGVAVNFAAIHCEQGVDNISQRIVITGNVIENSADSGIQLSSTTADRRFEDCVIANNTVQGVGRHGIMAHDVHKSTITGNTIRETAIDGIELNDCTDVAVSGNQVYDATFNGIQLDSCDRITVSGNNLYFIGQRGIWLSAATTISMVSANSIIAAGRTTNATYGAIELSNSGNNSNTITGNSIRKFGSGNEALTPIVVAGTTPSENYVVGNVFVGWSSTHASNFTLNGNTTVRTEISGTTTANSTRA